MGASTVLIVTQRVATVKNADRIVVLDEGRMVGAGKHGELMESCETYREIATSQLSAEELR
jgi:ATP-binding cassette subfamily B multidrug efflux pump